MEERLKSARKSTRKHPDLGIQIGSFLPSQRAGIPDCGASHSHSFLAWTLSVITSGAIATAKSMGPKFQSEEEEGVVGVIFDLGKFCELAIDSNGRRCSHI